MLADVRLLIAPKEARLIVRKGDDVIEDELWTFDRKIGRDEAESMSRALFADAYDLLQFVVHGDE